MIMRNFIKAKLFSILWRLGRFLYKTGRKESLFNQLNNKEFWVIDAVIKTLTTKEKKILFDVGCFKGKWSLHAWEKLKQKKINAKIFAFEPTSSTYDFLKIKFKNYKNILLNKVALSNTSGVKDFFIFGKMTGINTLVSNKNTSVIKVNTLTLDEFVEKNNIKNILFVKSDAEGYDFSIIKGATKSFNNKIIDFWQFEYNHRWIDNRHYLKDVFIFFEGSNYKIGKICRSKLEIYSYWHMELERFFEADFIIIKNDLLKKIPHNKVIFNKYNVTENE
tara:strand:- start:20189 stop:21019 length:831 start_codon:yes stop_codon:yes gene_type:complete